MIIYVIKYDMKYDNYTLYSNKCYILLITLITLITYLKRNK